MKGQATRDERFMARAIALARRGQGRTRPNPVVGAVVVRAGKVVGQGFHGKAGGPHAEVVALRQAGKLAQGATLYVSLEPCGHFGKTPPCSRAIVEAGIKRVVFASTDPNPLVNRRGVRQLLRARISVSGGVLADAADRLNEPFFKVMRQGLPWVTLKVASSLDGRVATHSGDSRWVSGPASRAQVHALREEVDAVVVGINTVLKDDPQLTARLPTSKRQPLRVVLDARLQLPLRATVVRTACDVPTWVMHGPHANALAAKHLVERGVRLLEVPLRAGKLDLRKAFAALAREGQHHLLVESGGGLATALLSQGLCDDFWLVIAPKLVGRDGLSFWREKSPKLMREVQALTLVSCEQVGADLSLRLRPSQQESA